MTMYYALVNRGDSLSLSLAEKFNKLAAMQNLTFNREEPHVVVTIGGDGTLLQAFHHYKPILDKVSFVGIHTGHLGFYADWTPDELEGLVGMMAAHSPATIRTAIYPVLEMQVESKKGRERFLALNESTVKCLEGTLVIQADINQEPFETFRGDGLCISTPSGSTAYNKSLGGAVLHPSLESIQLAEIASINNRVYRTLGSSLVLPKHHQLSLYPKGRKEKCILFSLDHLNFQREEVSAIHYSVAQEKVRFARFRSFPFWNRVREAFIDFEQN